MSTASRCLGRPATNYLASESTTNESSLTPCRRSCMTSNQGRCFQIFRGIFSQGHSLACRTVSAADQLCNLGSNQKSHPAPKPWGHPEPQVRSLVGARAGSQFLQALDHSAKSRTQSGSLCISNNCSAGRFPKLMSYHLFEQCRESGSLEIVLLVSHHN